ncbi:hypothetical protein CLIB1444_10S02036 [[Candida] jaroonii]|uniref:Uncharacterized protein n=1 Tax=[Candida] jaroonii TaxID=467808 RepID=A0ACA9YD24_9ASCO|nr:hypothetical protein CLIB1444_10S02036 [[Candida] jaroonii]
MMTKKRQRRSYSCGPCKMLKIKCDLQMPCSSCQKFKREDKCRLNPPNPPNKDELKLIQERRERINKRKTDVSEVNSEPVLSYTLMHMKPLQSHQTPGQMSNQLPSHQLQNPPMMVGGGQFTQIPLPLPNQLPPLGGQYGHQGQYTNQLPPIHQSLQMTNPPNIYQYLPVSVSTPLIGGDEKDKQAIIDFFAGHNMEFSFKEDSFNPFKVHILENGKSVFHDDIEAEKTSMIKLTKEEVRKFREIFPSNGHFLKLLLSYFSCFYTDLLELIDIPLIIRWSIKLSNDIANSNEEEIYIELFGFRCLSLALIISALGLLANPKLCYSGESSHEKLARECIAFSKELRDRCKNIDSFLGITCMLVWYLTAENYYEYSNNCEENHFEYNNLLSNLLFNKTYMGVLSNKQICSTKMSDADSFKIKLILRYWMRIRTIELDILYFQYKSSLLQSNLQYKNAIIPSADILSFVYDNDLTGIRNECQRYTLVLSGAYFKQFNANVGNDFKTVVKTYLSVYDEFYKKSGDEFVKAESNFNSCTKENVVSFLKNTIVNTIFVKWLSFIKIESNYFPSLRYTSYITTIISLHNHYMRLDNILAKDGGNLLNSVLNESNVYHLRFIVHSTVVAQVFLICFKLKYDLNDDKKYVLDLKQLFNIMNGNFSRFFTKFIKDFKNSRLVHLTSFNQSIEMLIKLNNFFNNTVYNSELILDDFCRDLNNKLLDLYKPFIDNFFGCTETMLNYITRIWEFFEYIQQCDPQTKILITEDLEMNDELFLRYKDKFNGFEITDTVINGYIEAVVEPSLSEEEHDF